MKKLFRRLFPDKEKRAFNRMHRRHRKELIKHAKETYEWDWGWLHDSIIMQIRHIHEYYSEGNNVWQEDESQRQIVEQLQHVLDLQEELDHVFDDKVEREREIVSDGVVKFHITEGELDKLKAQFQREQDLYREMYKYIGQHIQEWWD